MEYKAHKDIPNALRKYRRIRGLSQKEVADILGFRGASRISRWESGDCMPSLINAIRLSVLYQNMVDGLFSDLVIQLRVEMLQQRNQVPESKDS